MADQQKDNGPYSVYGRRTEHEAEVRVGMAHDLEHAKKDADLLVDSGIWHQATVRDRSDQTVHVGMATHDRDKVRGDNDLPPAA